MELLIIDQIPQASTQSFSVQFEHINSIWQVYIWPEDEEIRGQRLSQAAVCYSSVRKAGSFL